MLGAHGNDEAATNNGRVYVFEQVEPSNVAVAYDGHETVKIGFTSNVVTDTVVDTNTSNLNVEIAGDLTLTGSANVFLSNATAIHANSNVVTEFKRSKKLIKYPRVAMASASQDGYTVTGSSSYSSVWALWRAFDNNLADNGGSWASAASTYSADGQTYTGSGTLGGYSGEFVQIQLPEK